MPTPIPASGADHVYEDYGRVLSGHVAPLEAVPAGLADGPLRLAVLIPPFGFGSGGHLVVFQLVAELERRGHVVTCVVHDPHGEHGGQPGRVLRHLVHRAYVPVQAPFISGFDDWPGCDVVIATGWQTAYPAMTLPGCRARAYLVNDHEPEFYPTSVESLLAARTYTFGMPAIVGGGPWLEQTLTRDYGEEVVARFPYPVDDALVERPVPRRDDTIVVYGRDSTPRRGVGLALLALVELKRRRPDLRVLLFGDEGMPQLPFPYEHLGRRTPEELSYIYSEAAVGVAFSLTHGSLVPHDMLACGLPVVDLDGFGTAAEHRDTGLVSLAAPDPDAIATAVEALLDDPAERARRSAAGRAYVGAHTWPGAADRVEAALRTILSTRAAA